MLGLLESLRSTRDVGNALSQIDKWVRAGTFERLDLLAAGLEQLEGIPTWARQTVFDHLENSLARAPSRAAAFHLVALAQTPRQVSLAPPLDEASRRATIPWPVCR